MPRPANSFQTITHVPTHYARPPVAPYGTRGEARAFFTTQEFEAKLEACLQELWEHVPFGAAEVITSAGAWVDKPGFHGLGRALDVDGIFWAEHDFITLDYPSDPVFYLGVEAIFRRHFGTVLNYLYNIDHHDHLHVDDGTEVGFSETSRSRALFLQAALTHVFEIPVLIDGLFGPQTAGATREALVRIGSTGNIGNKQTWKKLLRDTATLAFEKAAGPVDPPELLRRVYRIIEVELEGQEARKRVETALTAFAEHPSTTSWLEAFDG